MKTIEKEHLCIVGDIHGELGTLVYNITEKYKLKDTAIIIAGDVGLGFNQPGWYDSWYYKQESRLKDNNNIIYGIRGNHDNPEFFNGNRKLDYPYFKTLEDYVPLEWKGKLILPIGGASSIDVKERMVENSKWEKRGSSRRCWWPNERPDKVDLDSLPGKIDIVVSHEAPLSAGHTLIRETWMDFDLYERIREDREYLYSIVKEKLPERWYFGHYHKSFSGNLLETIYKGLDIQELVEVLYYED